MNNLNNKWEDLLMLLAISCSLGNKDDEEEICKLCEEIIEQ